MALRTRYFLGEALINLRRNFLMTVSAVSIVLVSLLLLGFVLVLGQIVEQFIGGFESQVEVNVYLTNDVTPDQTKEIEGGVSDMPEVKSFDFISKEQAFGIFKELYKETPAIYENVDPEFLPASYKIELHDAKSAQIVTTRLTGRPGVDEVIYGGEAVKRLLTFSRLVRVTFLGFTVVFLIAATALIVNTIRLAIYARRREIAIMRLVGASNWFIRVPFIFEGVLEGAFGAILASAIVASVKLLVLDSLQQSLVFLPITIGWDVVLRIFTWLLLVGVAVGALGSTVALRRFLQV